MFLFLKKLRAGTSTKSFGVSRFSSALRAYWAHGGVCTRAVAAEQPAALGGGEAIVCI